MLVVQSMHSTEKLVPAKPILAQARATIKENGNPIRLTFILSGTPQQPELLVSEKFIEKAHCIIESSLFLGTPVKTPIEGFKLYHLPELNMEPEIFLSTFLTLCKRLAYVH